MTDLLQREVLAPVQGYRQKLPRIRRPTSRPTSLSPPSPAAPKELFVAIRESAGGGYLTANLSRAVVQTVRQSSVDDSQYEVDEFFEVADAWQVESTEVSLPSDSGRLPDELTRRLESLLRDAEQKGKLRVVVESFSKLVAAEIASKGETALGSFLDHARRLDGLGQTDTALDIIFDQVDEMLLADEFDRVNQLLIDTTTVEFSVELLLGILTATLPAKSRLPNRCEFFDRVVQTLQSRGEFKDRLLIGLD